MWGLRRKRQREWKASYAQCGEDVLVAYLFGELLGITHPSYLDIGAHHPTILSNTYHFYENGCRGVCVEPDPVFHSVIARKRPGDLCLNVGVAAQSRPAAEFYLFKERTLSTFSASARMEVEGTGKGSVEAVMKIDVIGVNELLERYCQGTPNFVSLDTEGTDVEILRAFDFQTYRPEVFCIETVSYAMGSKVSDVTTCMRAAGYAVYADTFMNTIYVDVQAWKRTGLRSLTTQSTE